MDEEYQGTGKQHLIAGPNRSRDALSTDLRVRLEKATFSLNGMAVFEETDWAIGAGEHWAIIGPNGGGKTTLARALCREIPLISGSIRFFFDPERDTPGGCPWIAADEVIRLSPDTPDALLGRYGGYHQARWQSSESAESPTAADLLDAGRKPGACPGRDDNRNFSEQLIDRLGIRDLLDKRILHLSNGEVRKVAIARALLRQPRILVLDDPFSGLDDLAKSRLRDLIAHLLAGASPQVILITHHPDEIPPGISRCLLVHRLRVIARGTPRQMRQRFGEISPGGADGIGMMPESEEGPVRRPSPGVPIVRMEHVTVSYGRRPILRNLDWLMHSGEHWAISGANGAGKSTLLSLILADNPQAYANRIFLFGIHRGSGESIWEIKRRIGWVAPELHGYYTERLTGLALVCSGFFDTIGLYRECTPDQFAAARRTMAALGIRHLEDRRTVDISTGEKRLLLLARALVKEPELLVLDEPCQGLDPPHRQAFVRLIDALAARSGFSMIYVTHHPDELPAAITHQMILSAGTVLYSGRKSG